MRKSMVMALVLVLVSASGAWDSRTAGGLVVGVPLHGQFTGLAIQRLRNDYAELRNKDVQLALLRGCLTELHEEKSKAVDVADGNRYGLNVEVKREEHKGTNEGCDDMEGWWNDARAAYRAGNRPQAYFILGIMLHMIEDMGVPAHANKVHHQGNLTEFDNFEFNSTFNGSFITRGIIQLGSDSNDYVLFVSHLSGAIESGRINKSNPNYGEPWRYYEFSRAWTAEDAPDYRDRNAFPKTRVWPFWRDSHKNLMQNRQNRTYAVALWALESGVQAFQR